MAYFEIKEIADSQQGRGVTFGPGDGCEWPFDFPYTDKLNTSLDYMVCIALTPFIPGFIHLLGFRRPMGGI